MITELEKSVLPQLTDGASVIQLHMVFETLRHCAARAQEEIHLMNEEAALYRSFASDIASRAQNDALTSAVDQATPSPTERLNDVSRAYDAAGDAFGHAMEVAFERGWRDDVARAEALLVRRIDNECSMTKPVGAGR